MSRLQPEIARLFSHVLANARSDTDAFMAGPPDPEADAWPESRRGRRLLWADGLISNISESFVTNFVNPFALALGATNTQIGWMSALSNLASALALIPGARLGDRPERRKQVTVWFGGGVARALLLGIALAPTIFAGHAAIYAFIALVCLRAFFIQLSYPAWSAFLADLVSPRIRGRYFASRNIGLAVAALIFTPVAGAIAQRFGLPQGYQVSFLLAGLIGFVATAVFARIPPPPAQAASAAAGGREGVWQLLRTHPRFSAFAAVAFLWNLSLMVMGPFFSVYLVRNLGASPVQIGLLAAINSLANIIGQRIWGRLNDQRGAAWVMRVTGLLIPLIPLFWSLVPNPWALMPVEALAGFLWAGYGLSNFNLLLSLAPGERRPRFVAIYQVSVFSAAFVGPLLGSVLANALNLRPLLWISTVGRTVAALLFVFTVRGDREADEGR